MELSYSQFWLVKSQFLSSSTVPVLRGPIQFQSVPRTGTGTEIRNTVKTGTKTTLCHVMSNRKTYFEVAINFCAKQSKAVLIIIM